MRKFKHVLLAMCCALLPSLMWAETTAYGYTMSPAASPALISFTTENPATTTTVGSYTTLEPRSGAAVDKTLYMMGLDDDWNVWFYSMSLENGGATKIKKLGDITCPGDLAYDYAGEKMYYVANSERTDSRSAIGTVNLTTGARTSISDNVGYYCKAIAVDGKGQAYLLSNEGQLLKVDKTNGKCTVVGNTGVALSGSWNFQSMDFDRSTGVLYWAAWTSEGKSVLYKVNTTTGAATEVGVMGNGTHTVALAIPYEASAESAPDKVANLAVKADENGALSATLTWVNPTLDNQGNALNSLTKAEVLCNDAVVATIGNATVGANMTYTHTPSAAGMCQYAVRVYNEVGASADQLCEAWVGHDLPAAPTAAVAALNRTSLMKNDLSWNAPEVGMHGGYVDWASLKYNVVRKNDNTTIAAGLSATSLVDANLLKQLTRYEYTITALTADGVGESVTTNALVNGPACKIPYVGDFSTWEEGGQFWTPLNGNEDETTFVWYKDFMNMFKQGFDKGYYIYQPSETMYAYDFLISPPIEFTEGHTYKITVNASNDDIAGYREEYFRLYTMSGYTLAGAVPMGDEVFVVKHPGEFRDYTFEFDVADDGMGTSHDSFVSFISVCCLSKYDMGMLLLSKVSIEDLTEPTGVADINVSANNAGNATYNVMGQRVNENATGIVIKNGVKMLKR